MNNNTLQEPLTVKDLNREQLSELKVNYLSGKVNDNCLSYEEILKINEIVSDKKMFEVYADTVFYEEDFFCSVGEKENV